MWNIKAKINYSDYSPRQTKRLNKEIEILKDKDGNEYFSVSAGDMLVVSNERGQYLVGERKLGELVSIEKEVKEVEVAINKPTNIETADIKIKPKKTTKPKKK